MTSHSENLSRPPLRIVIALPELRLLQQVMQGDLADATFIIQAYIAEGLKRRGHTLGLLGPFAPGGTLQIGDLQQLEPVPYTWTGRLWFELLSKVTWRVQRLVGMPYLNVFSNLRLMDACLQVLAGYDLVYERNHLYRCGVAMACKRLGIPYVLFIEADDILEHDVMNTPIKGWLRFRAQRVVRYNLDTAVRVICVSEPLKTHLIRKWNVSTEKIVVFPNVADVRRFRPDLDARDAVRETLGIGEAPLVIFVGNFYPWHDVATLLRAFVTTLAAHPDARLMLVGDGTTRRAMTQLALDLGIERAIMFTGMVAHAEVPRLMAAADVAVVPYPVLRQDVWLSPLKLFEYMATGNAIIASRVGQLPDWVDDERSGLLVPPGDGPALAASLNRLIEDRVLRQRLGRGARQAAVRDHSWDRYLADLEELCRSVLGKGKH